jgi:Fic family protein
MTSFDGFGARFDLVPAEIVTRLGRIDRDAGREDLYRQELPRLLEALRDRAQVESVEASSAIEGVTAPHARAKAVVRDPTTIPRNRSEAELRGYSNALTYCFNQAVRESRLSVGLVLHLHRLLYEPAGVAGAGQFKTADNLVIERDATGHRQVRFTPVTASRTPAATADLVAMYEDVLARRTHHPIIPTAAFVLDFTIIHPFAHGNGRVSRLLLNLLLDRNGYDVGRYVSIERHIEQTKERYYDTLAASTSGWHQGSHDVWPWTRYLVEIVESAYDSFTAHAEEERSRGSKQERVRRYLEEHAQQNFSMYDLRQALPSISDSTIRGAAPTARRGCCSCHIRPNSTVELARRGLGRPTVHHQYLAVDIARGVRHQEDCCPGNLLGITNPPHGILLHHPA